MLQAAAAHQALNEVVRDPQLLQRAADGIQAVQLLDQVAPQRQPFQPLQPRQPRYLLDVIG